jgi:hypothetical protein
MLVTRESIDPTSVGKIIKEIAEKNGKCTPKDVLEVARNKESILHPMFEWDDRKAGEAFRKQQAGSLIRSIQVVRLSDDKKALERKSLMVHVPTTNKNKQEEPGYVTIEFALKDKVARAKVVEMALGQLKGIRAKYGDFNELDEIWGAIDRVTKWRGQPVQRTTEEDRKAKVDLRVVGVGM